MNFLRTIITATVVVNLHLSHKGDPLIWNYISFYALGWLITSNHDVSVSIIGHHGFQFPSSWERSINVYSNSLYGNPPLYCLFSPCVWFVGPWMQHIFHIVSTQYSTHFNTIPLHRGAHEVNSTISVFFPIMLLTQRWLPNAPSCISFKPDCTLPMYELYDYVLLISTFLRLFQQSVLQG